nr:MAG TPA: hypothetical protein [Caudoviricetes sp.]
MLRKERCKCTEIMKGMLTQQQVQQWQRSSVKKMQN